MNWIDREIALGTHRQMIAQYGGGDGVRDESALLAGLNRAQNHHAYGNPTPDIAELAAVYAGGIILNHPFVDGNKRTGYILASLFIEWNGYILTTSEVDVVIWTLKLAARACEESDYAGWLRANMKERPKTLTGTVATKPVVKTRAKAKPKAKKK